jgi:hypothetical protein
MNNLYFACCECKIYIDAGYRWAYWELEHRDLVSRKKDVAVEAVLAAQNYWNPPKDETCRWLYEEIFPPLRAFIENHQRHRLIFGELEDFAPEDDYYLYWMQVGYCMQPTVRYLVEVLGLATWEQVDKYMSRQDLPAAWWEVTWWGNPSSHEKGKQRFETLVREKQVS